MRFLNIYCISQVFKRGSLILCLGSSACMYNTHAMAIANVPIRHDTEAAPVGAGPLRWQQEYIFWTGGQGGMEGTKLGRGGWNRRWVSSRRGVGIQPSTTMGADLRRPIGAWECYTG